MVERKDIMQTRKAIWQAYLALSAEKPKEDISASALIKRSGLSRATFYGYYSDIASVQKEIEDNFTAVSMEILLPLIRELFHHTEDSIYQIFRFFEKNSAMIRAITTDGRNSSYYDRCRQQIGKNILRCAFTCTIDERAVLQGMILAGMIMDQAKDIVNNSMQYSISMRAAVFTEVMMNGISSGD